MESIIFNKLYYLSFGKIVILFQFNTSNEKSCAILRERNARGR